MIIKMNKKNKTITATIEIAIITIITISTPSSPNNPNQSSNAIKHTSKTKYFPIDKKEPISMLVATMTIPTATSIIIIIMEL